MLKLISSIPSLASGIDSGQGIVHRSDEVSGVQMYRNVGHGGLIIEIQAVVLVRVERALLVISSAYHWAKAAKVISEGDTPVD
jgi:hypothetical protein